MRRRAVLWWLLLFVPVGMWCGARVAQAKSTVLTVFAAASLSDVMDDARKAFEKSHPGLQVRVNTASSAELRLQLEQGARADVFLSADTANMNPLVASRVVGKPQIFAHNSLAIVVTKRSRDKVQGIGDLADSGLRLAVAAPATPIGRYTRAMFGKVGKCGKDFRRKGLANTRSEEPTVRAVLAKVLLGEVDAGVVYATDIAPGLRKTARLITIPAEYNVVASYPIAVLTRSRNKVLAQQFQNFILSPQGKQLLQERGFTP